MSLLSRLPKILREGIRKTTNEVLSEVHDKYTRGSNPVKYFVEKGMEQSGGSESIQAQNFTITIINSALNSDWPRNLRSRLVEN